MRRILPLLLLASTAGCFPWPARSRAFYPRASIDERDPPRVVAGADYVFERCRGTFIHPMVTGHCLYLVVRRDRVAERQTLTFPGTGTRAVLAVVNPLPRGTGIAPTGWMYVREVRPG